jgi:signal peptidase II
VILFAIVALAIGVSDQLLKRWIVANYGDKLGQPSPVIGDWFRINFIHNNGGLFGLFQGQAQIFALVTLGVVAVLVAVEVLSGWRSWFLTITLGLLLGGAIGNFIDRLRLGYVVDFADIGIGAQRFYIFNIADSAVTVAILMMLALWFVAPYLGIPMPGDKEDRGADEPDGAGSVEAR